MLQKRTSPLPHWHPIEPSPVAAFAVGFFVCGPLAAFVYMIILFAGGAK